ncbi:MAG: cytidine deaminase [Lachnospiraceae bacterium]|nr:cytidine deaminase [Lachnospiraceae bacterium]
MDEQAICSLIDMALEARESSYSPYSNYKVGAALIAGSGKIYKGCNIENASYGATNCAERTAVFKAVSEGERYINAIAIVGGPKDAEIPLPGFAFPCGICRQVLREFSDPDKLIVIVARSKDDYKVYTLADLLPDSFGPDFTNQ